VEICLLITNHFFNAVFFLLKPLVGFSSQRDVGANLCIEFPNSLSQQIFSLHLAPAHRRASGGDGDKFLDAWLDERGVTLLLLLCSVIGQKIALRSAAGAATAGIKNESTF
jgi:hypothetical protein